MKGERKITGGRYSAGMGHVGPGSGRGRRGAVAGASGLAATQLQARAQARAAAGVGAEWAPPVRDREGGGFRAGARRAAGPFVGRLGWAGFGLAEGLVFFSFFFFQIRCLG